MIQQNKGKLIVIEGGDGSGKGTQADLLIKYFEKNNIPHATVDFPDYDSAYGKIIARFLRGEFGNLDEISPYFVGTLFGLDRSLQKDILQEHLKQGKIVVANRYVTSNMAHQGSKIVDQQELNTFLQWLENFEYGVLGLPREDLVIYLYVPWQIALQLTKTKEKRTYLQGEAEDIQEKDEKHRQDTEKMYQQLASQHHHWDTLVCTKDGTILSRERIHELIIEILQKRAIT
ncbi:deoxynucleoside kinase [Candidatus Woesebacteria bacterium]|nr:deoxynucleoside kinase [Candidatus Woesebacteria bacterium]